VQIVTGAGVEGLKAEVVENEKIGAAEGFDQARMAPVASRERHVLAEFWPAMDTSPATNSSSGAHRKLLDKRT
jgi:hypothetical protein